MSVLASIRSTFVPVHREGWRFGAVFAAVALAFFAGQIYVLGGIFVVITLWCLYFFRNPARVTPLRAGLVISPADGRVSMITQVIPPPELDLPRELVTRISIFMNVFDVHINRAPVDGRIAKLTYIAGRFVNAELDKASEHNERQALTIAMPDGKAIGVVQIAGLIARRIIKFVNEGDNLAVGQRFGLIRFGSRVDVYLPPGGKALACLGQRAIAGETVLADLASAEETRSGRRA